MHCHVESWQGILKFCRAHDYFSKVRVVVMYKLMQQD